MLDLLEGKLKAIAPDRAALARDLSTEEGQDNLLLAGLAFGAHRRGLVLEPSEIYRFSRPPALGGAIEVENVEVTDFVVAVNIAGQIHEQVRGMRPGTPVGKITINDVPLGPDLPNA